MSVWSIRSGHRWRYALRLTDQRACLSTLKCATRNDRLLVEMLYELVNNILQFDRISEALIAIEGMSDGYGFRVILEPNQE